MSVQLESGYAGLITVRSVPAVHDDTQQSFFLAGTASLPTYTKAVALSCRSYLVALRSGIKCAKCPPDAETLKYLFLLFSSDDMVPLDEFVLNTEAHPLRLVKSSS